MIFKGKISNWYYLIVGVTLVVMGSPLIIFIETKDVVWFIASAVILLLCIMICVPPLLRNYVEVKEDSFIVYFGLSKKEYLLKDINTLYKSRDFTAGSACSLDRIYIDTKEADMLISLKENDRFIEEVKKRNPNIK